MDQSGETSSQPKDWLPYEDELLKALRRYHHRPSDWRFFPNYFHGRNALECHARWLEISSSHHQRSGYIPKRFEKPTSRQPFSRLGLLPRILFMEICRYLTPKEVFVILPLVCQKYYHWINKYQIPIQQIELDYEEDSALKMHILSLKVVDCEKVQLKRIPNRSNSFWVYSMEGFLLSQIDTIIDLRCYTQWQPAIVRFVNESEKLQSLLISMTHAQGRWNWKNHTIQPSLRKLHYRENNLGSVKAAAAIDRFPDLNRALIFSHGPTRGERLENLSWNDTPGLKKLEGTITLRDYQCQQLEEIRLRVDNNIEWYHMIRQIANLPTLLTAILNIHSDILRAALKQSCNKKPTGIEFHN